jgi:GTP-binding protein
MSKKKKLPVVAICGRPNVGKSTLYNRLSGKQQAIIHDEEGITRDRHITTVQWDDYQLRLVDTGGIVENPIDSIVQKMQTQVHMALEEATVIIFLVDGQQELTRIDLELREQLFRYGKPVVLAINKLDNEKLNLNKNDFYELGMGEPIAISSGHNLGIGELKEEVCQHLPDPKTIEEDGEDDGDEEEIPEDKVTRVAIVGKPNVGKSSFINAILNEERTIVDDTPGTTRDAIDIEYNWKGKDYLLIDTAGMRKKAGIKQHVEHFSIARSLRAVRRADICMVMVDATDGIAEQDKRIIGYIQEQGTAMIIVWCKWDLIEDKEQKFKQLKDELDLKVPYLKYVSYMTISNVTRQRLFKTFDLLNEIEIEANRSIGTSELNKFFAELKFKHKPSSVKGKLAKVLYATQGGILPTRFILFVNQKKLFHFSYLRYIENRLRDEYGFKGVPIQIELREEKPKK